MKYGFDTFSVDSDLRLLREGDQQLALKPKHVQVLCFLLAKRPSVASNREILDALWPGDNANQGYVTTAIGQIKRWLRDTGNDSRYIRNVYGQGYAFIYPDVRTGVDSSQHPEDHGEAPRPEVANPPLSRAKYGIRAQRAISMWQILDGTGAVHRIQRVEGLKAEPGVVLPYIEGRSRQWTPGCSIRERPTLGGTSDFPKKVRLVFDNESNLKESGWRLVIAGSLTEHDPPFNYSISTTINDAVLMSNDAVALAYAQDEFKYDYVAWDAELPVESLELSVQFPHDIPVECFPGVFWGPSEWFFHDLELSRVRDGFTSSDSAGIFVIDKPIVGFRYFIYWSFK